MRTSSLIARLLVLLGFCGVAGMTAGCGANRASKSRTRETCPAADPVVVGEGDGYAPIRVMYGVPSARFDPDKPIRQKAPGQTE